MGNDTRSSFKVKGVCQLNVLDGTLLAEAAKNGLWAVLYVSLYIYTLREARRQEMNARERENKLREEYNQFREESRERENKLQAFINEMTKQYERITLAVERLTLDVEDIKHEIKLHNKQTRSRRKDERIKGVK